MYASENSHEHVERDPRNDPRSRTHAEEIIVDRPPIVADRPQHDDSWPSAPVDRRRSERRRIERTSTDI
jgi:hypothetical protein